MDDSEHNDFAGELRDTLELFGLSVAVTGAVAAAASLVEHLAR